MIFNIYKELITNNNYWVELFETFGYATLSVSQRGFKLRSIAPQLNIINISLFSLITSFKEMIEFMLVAG